MKALSFFKALAGVVGKRVERAVNRLLLEVIYVVGVGVTHRLGRLVGKEFVQLKGGFWMGRKNGSGVSGKMY